MNVRCVRFTQECRSIFHRLQAREGSQVRAREVYILISFANIELGSLTVTNQHATVFWKAGGTQQLIEFLPLAMGIFLSQSRSHR